MLGIMPESGTAIDFDIVRSFRKLASCGMVSRGSSPGHIDGWGIVAWKNDLPVYLGREPTNAFVDSKFDEACATGEASRFSSPLIAHLRKASVGLKIRENTHPFVNAEWAFAHNGTIRKLNLRYTTDSLWFFEGLMREHERNGGDFVKSVRKSSRDVHRIFPYTSLTFLASDGRNMYAYRDSSKNPEYYATYYTRIPGAVIIAQEKFFDAEWVEVRNHALLSVNAQLQPEVIEVESRFEASLSNNASDIPESSAEAH